MEERAFGDVGSWLAGSRFREFPAMKANGRKARPAVWYGRGLACQSALRMHASVLFGSGEGALCIAYSANFGRGKAFMMSGVSLQRAFRRISGKEGRWKKSAACGLAWGFGLSKRFADARIRFVRERGKRFMHCISGGFLKERTFGMPGAGPRGDASKKRAARA